MKLSKIVLSLLFAAMSVATYAQSSTTPIIHTVERGETLASIAEKYGTTAEKLKEMNPDAKQFIYVGMELNVPTQELSQMTNILVQEKASVSPIGNTKKDDTNISEIKNEDASYSGLVLYTSPQHKQWKYGGIIGWEGAFTNQNGWGGALTMGGVASWKPKFDLGSTVTALGPCYGTELSPTTDLFVPIQLMMTTTNSFKKILWGGMISPTLKIGCLAIGGYVIFDKNNSSVESNLVLLVNSLQLPP